MAKQLDLAKEASKLSYESKRNYLLKQEETSLHKLFCCVINRLGENYRAEITHGRDERGRDLVVKQRDAFGSQYIGVIVKKGNAKGELTGKTDKEIDEVISQANQAMSHPCILRELEAGAVRINQLWIFFVGRLTSTASERIEYELKDVSRRIFPLEDIVDLFEKNYPEVFFNPVLAEFVEAHLAKAEDLDKPRGVKKKYITPWVSKWETAGEITEALVNVMYSKKLPFQKLTDVISAGGKIILTGEPGIGKTTALVKIASDMLKKNFVEKSKNPTKGFLEAPILIKAKELAVKTMDEIYREFITLPEIEEQVTIKTLLVDGLDEVQVEKREECVGKANEFADKYRCGLVITCRKIPMLLSVLSPFDRYELLPLEYEQAIAFVEQALKDRQLIEVLKEGILRNEFKIQLTPLALELLIEVATYEREVPASLAEIFERYMDITCGKYDKGKGIETVFEHHVKERFLAELAWEEFHTKELLDIPKKVLDIFLEKYAKKYRWDGDSLNRFVSEIERSGLLRIDEKVSFWHRSFLDFFVAWRISKNKGRFPKLNKEIVNIYFNDMWTDVAFYYVGIEREMDPEIIRGIEEYPLDNFDICVYKVLIGRLLQAGWHTPSEEKIKAIEIGLDNVENVRDFVDRMLSTEKRKLPAIFSDFFYMAVSEYSFGSRTMLPETNTICDRLMGTCDLKSLRNCLLLIWAQRSRLTEKAKVTLGKQLLGVLAGLEKEGKLLVRDKFVSLFMLEQIEKENKEVLGSIRRKIKRTKELYPGDMRRLLPPSKGAIRFSIRRQKRRGLTKADA